MARHLRTVVVGAVVYAAAGIIVAQTSALTRTMVTKADVSVPGREAVVARVEIAPGGIAAGTRIRATRSATSWTARPR